MEGHRPYLSSPCTLTTPLMLATASFVTVSITRNGDWTEEGRNQYSEEPLADDSSSLRLDVLSPDSLMA